MDEVPWASFDDSTLLIAVRYMGHLLPQAVVEECVRRGDRLIPGLAALVRDDAAWTARGPESWATMHATFILGGIGRDSDDERIADTLLAALARAYDHDVTALVDAFPAIAAAQAGPTLLDRLLDQIPGSQSPIWIVGLGSVLGGICAHAPERRERIAAHLRAAISGQAGTAQSRDAAACVLTDLRRAEDREFLLAYARSRDGQQGALFVTATVEKIWSDTEFDALDAARWFENWLEFYSPEERQRRSNLVLRALVSAADRNDLQEWLLREAGLVRRPPSEPAVPPPRGRPPGPQAGRNAPCPCGSGRKYKHCCGRP